MKQHLNVAERIAKYAQQLGYEVRTFASDGGSYYVELSYGDEDHVEALKVRIADHDLPPTYAGTFGRADFEVGPHSRGHVDGWKGVVSDLAERMKKPVPARVSSGLAQDRAKQQAKAAQQKQAAALYLERSKAHAAPVDAEMRRLGLEGLSGRARKKARQKIRKKLGLVNTDF